jgi:prepilin-type processing-associated H-X9-DG protein
LAAQLYVNQNHGYFPIARDRNAEWDFSVSLMGAIEPGILWSGRGVLKIQQCPSWDGVSPTAPGDPYTGYNYNTSFIGHGVGELHVPPAKATQVRRSAEVALFGDGGYAAGTNKYMRAPREDLDLGDKLNNLTRIAGTQAYRHRGKTNVVFCDGHGESLKDAFDITGQPTTKPFGFLSPDNRRYNLE